MLPEQQQRIMGYFIEEAKDHLKTIEQGLLNLQSTIADPETVSEVFRAAHSVKGGAAMLGLTSIQQTAHRLEDYFKVLKECPVPVDQRLETLFLRIFDTLQELIDQLQGPFGLTSDKAQEAMAGVEPVFAELGQHLNLLVSQSGGALPEDVELLPVAAQLRVARPAAAQPVPAQPAIAREESALQLIFQSDVPAQLREMLQLFKQTDTAETRQQLQLICRSLSQPGEQLELPNWCDLLTTVAKAIGNPDTTYRALAPIVIKEIKHAQELVLSGRSTQITACENLLELVPPEPPESDAALDNVTDVDLADLFATVDAAESSEEAMSLSSFDESGFDESGFDESSFDESSFDDLEDLRSVGATSEPHVENQFNSEQTEEPISFSGFFDGEVVSEPELSSSNSANDLSSDFDLGFGAEETTYPSDRLPELGLPDDLSLIDGLDAAALADEHQPGPEVGVAELNSLADLFEGEVPDLGMTWQEEEMIQPGTVILPDLYAIEPANDFADLMFAQDPGEALALDEDDDLSGLLNASTLGNPQRANFPQSLHASKSNETASDSFNWDALDLEALTSIDSTDPVAPEAASDDFDASLFESIDFSEPAIAPSRGESDFENLDELLATLDTDNLWDDIPEDQDIAASDRPLDLDSALDLDSSLNFDLASDPASAAVNQADAFSFELESQLETEPNELNIAEPSAEPIDLSTLDATSLESSSEDNFDLSSLMGSDFSLMLGDSTDPALDQPLSEGLFAAKAEVAEFDPLAFGLDLPEESPQDTLGLASLGLDGLELDGLELDGLEPDSAAIAADPLEFNWDGNLAASDELNFGADEVTAFNESDFNPFEAAQLPEFAIQESSQESSQESGEANTPSEEPEESFVFDSPASPRAEEASSIAAHDLADLDDFANLDDFADLDAFANSTQADRNHTNPNQAIDDFADLDAFNTLDNLDLDNLLSEEAPAENITASAAFVAPDFAAHDITGNPEGNGLENNHHADGNDPVENDQTDDFADLEAFLGEDQAIAPAASPAEDHDFADLDALLEDEMPDAIVSAVGSPSRTAGNQFTGNQFTGAQFTGEQFTGEQFIDDFADLDALLDEPSTSPASLAALPAVEDEFGDLEDLLKDADQKLGGTPAARGNRPASSAANRRPQRRTNLTDQTMRVSVRHLDNLNNLVGEIVVNRNSLEEAQERLRQFLDNLLYQVQQLSDVGQRMRDLYERSLLESSLLSSRRSYNLSPANGGFSAAQPSHATGLSFDALEMDRFTGFHTLSQEMIELIVRVRESASDIDFVVDESDQVTRNFRQITTQLQEGLTRSRMVHFAQTADRLPRGVRDNAVKYGKQAELLIEGRDTLIDKMIVEQLYDPMTHLVNNAVAHGIETPAERVAAGKPPTGKVTIRAFHHGNQTVISVSDDGAGIDPERVKAKAVSKKVITAAEAKEMSRLDVYDLLFHHGFSTADQVDDLRGRGIGLDVVRSNLTEIRGVITIDSAIGKGTTFSIRLPLTLSISKALCCISNRARIAFPMDGVEDMLDVPKERIQTDDQGNSFIQWRDTLLPFQPLPELLALNRVLGRGSVYGGNQEEDIASIVVLRSTGNFLALQVDQVLGEQEIVIKQLEGPVPKPIGIAGATVLGDGRIMPIADVLELIDLSQGRIRRESGSSVWEKGAASPVEMQEAKSEPTVLIVDDSITVRELLSMTFNKVGYRVEQARDGQEAWEKLRSGLPCDLVFCDIEMPRMDGLELLSRIQKDPQLTQIPIAMLTSRGADRHRQMAVQLGAKGYFTKPYLEEMLLDAAQRMLKGEVLVS